MRPFVLPLLVLGASFFAAGPAAGADTPETGGGAYLPGGSAASFSVSTASAERGRISEARAGLGRFVLRDLSLGLEAAGGVTSFPDDAPRAHTWHVGLDLVPRWHFHRGILGSLFADAGLGFRYFGLPFPQGGTRLDYALRAGLGLSVNAVGPVGAAFGLRFVHLSSAALSEEEGPGFNGLELSLGALLAW